jgi:hypothetical protein
VNGVCTAVVVIGALLLVACDVCDGDDVVERATLRNQDDVDDLEGVRCILGDLEIGSSGEESRPNDLIIDTSALSDLEVVEGDLEVALNQSLRRLELSSLTFIGRRLFERDSERVRGGFFVQANPILEEIDAPDLVGVGGCAAIKNNPRLDPGDVDDLFSQIGSHAFPGTCDGDAIEENRGNGTEL